MSTEKRNLKQEEKNIQEIKDLNFQCGFPGPDLLKRSQQMMLEGHKYMDEKYFSQLDDNFAFGNEHQEMVFKQAFSYACNKGNLAFRKRLAEFLKEKSFASDYAVDAEDLIITAGATQAHTFLFTRFGRNNGVVLVEDPTFLLMFGVIEETRMKCDSVPMESDGMNMEKLEEKLKYYESKGMHVDVVYTIPIHHNPTGIIMSVPKRLKLIELSQKYKFVIIADEVYQHLEFETCKMDNFCYYDNCKTGGTVFSVNSFTKTLSPGIRLGFIQVNSKARKHLIGRFNGKRGYLFASGGVNPFSSSILQGMFELGTYQDNLENLKSVYSHRLDRLCDILNECESFEYEKPKGGYFLWVKCKDNHFDMDTFLECCKEEKVQYYPGYLTSWGEKNWKRHLRLALAMPMKEIEDGASRLVRAARKAKKLHEVN